MFIRFVTFKSMPEKVEHLREFFNKEVYAALQQTPGCLFAALVESTTDAGEFSALTLWETADAIKAYEDSGRPAPESGCGHALTPSARARQRSRPGRF